jgi:hypothetical protein
MASTIRGQYDYLYEVDPTGVAPGSEMESQIGQFCELSYAYQSMCPNPDPTISLIYSSLCAPTTMQSARKFQEEKASEKTKKVVTKPKDKCFVKTEWEPCSCVEGTTKGTSAQVIRYTSKTGSSCTAPADVLEKMNKRSSCGDPTRSCRCQPIPLPSLPYVPEDAIDVQEAPIDEPIVPAEEAPASS